MAEMSTHRNDAMDADGRDFMAHNKLSQAEQRHGRGENVTTSAQLTVTDPSTDLLGNANNRNKERSLEFGELVSAEFGTFSDEELDFLEQEDFSWNENVGGNSRLEFTPDIHRPEDMALRHAENKPDLGQESRDKESNVHKDTLSGFVENEHKYSKPAVHEVKTSGWSKNSRSSQKPNPTKSENHHKMSSSSNHNHLYNLREQNTVYDIPDGNPSATTNEANFTQVRRQYSPVSDCTNTSNHTNSTHYFEFDRPDEHMAEVGSWHCHSKEKPKMDRLARNQLIAVCTLCTLFMIGETVGGVLSNSLALFTDVLHLASDLISFFIGLLAIYLSTKPPSRVMSFGYHRAEVLGALFSVFIIWLVTGVLCYMAVERIMKKHYTEVQPNEMLVTASIGVVFNIVMGVVLHTEKCCGGASSRPSFGHGHSHSHHASQNHSHHDDRSRIAYEPLNTESSEHELMSPVSDDLETEVPEHRHKNINIRAAFIHVVGDIIQSVGVLIASLIIKVTDDPRYKLADPICTFVFSILVLITTVAVLRDTLRIMMEGTPRDMSFQGILDDLQGLHGVKHVHSLAIWSLTIDRSAMAVHLAVEGDTDHQRTLEEATRLMKSKYHFYHLTIQVENYNAQHIDSCQNCDLPYK